MKNETVKIYLVPSTHWDREWYLPFCRLQPRLLRLFDKVTKLIDSGKYDNFLMDGQWIVLEDYLEAKPNQRAALTQKIRDGKLTFGPWYVVPDTLIPSGQALVKNLQIGQQFAAEYGRQLQRGYSPDSFGLAAQLPQLYRLFGFDAAMFTRGQRIEGDRTVEMWWQSPDGTRLPAMFGEYSYAITMLLPTVWRNIEAMVGSEENAIEQAKALLAADNCRTKLKNRLWVVGIDHVEPRENLPELVKAVNEANIGAEFVLSDMEQYFAAFLEEMQSADAPLSEGEQRGPYQEHFVLGNTLSTRIDVKKKNRQAEDLLTNVVGPLVALSAADDSFEALDTPALLALAWKKLVQNQAHDSICCCSADATVDDVEQRITHSLQLAREVEKVELARLGRSIRPMASKGALLVYNPMPFARSGRISADVTIPSRLTYIGIVDASGKAVRGATTTFLFEKRADIETLKANEFEEIQRDTTRVLMGGETDIDVYTGLHIELPAEDIPPYGYRCYYFAETAPAAEETAPRLESDFLKVNVNPDGTLQITDKLTGRVQESTHYFEITPDEGDSYTFSPAGAPFLTKGMDVELSEQDGKLQLHWQIANENGRMEIASALFLTDDGKGVGFSTRVRNEMRDMRLRVCFDYPDKAGCSVGNTAFDLTRRPVYEKNTLKPTQILTYPMRDIAGIQTERGLDTVACDSVHEYEAVTDSGNTLLALTLLRAVGKVYSTKTLTKDERSCGEGVRWWSEKDQMQGEYTFRYEMRHYEGEELEAQIINDALSHNIPLIPYGIMTQGEAEPAGMGCAVEEAVLSALEKKQDGTLEMTLYNPCGSTKLVKVSMEMRIAKAAIADFSGRILQKIPVTAPGTLCFEAGAHQILHLVLSVEQ